MMAAPARAPIARCGGVPTRPALPSRPRVTGLPTKPAVRKVNNKYANKQKKASAPCGRLPSPSAPPSQAARILPPNATPHRVGVVVHHLCGARIAWHTGGHGAQGGY